MGIEGIKYICMGHCFIPQSITSLLVLASLKNNMRVTHRIQIVPVELSVEF